MRAAIEAPGIGWLHFFWDSTQPVTLRFDNRLGQIKGRLKLADSAVLSGPVKIIARLTVLMIAPTGSSYQTWFDRQAWAAKDGSFQLDNLPPGRYFIELETAPNLPVDARRVESVLVGPARTRRSRSEPSDWRQSPAGSSIP